MKKSRFTELQIVKMLSEQEQGKSVSDICRTHRISQPTFYNWKSKYSGMSVNQLKKLKELKTELSSFKRRYAELALEHNALKHLIEKSFKSCYKARDCWVSGRSV